MKKALRWVALLAGAFLFGWLVHRAGPRETFRTLAGLGVWAPVVLLPYAMVYVWDNLGWYLAFGRYAKRQPGYWMLFRARWAGESVNYIIPSAYVGGEAIKVWLLHRRGVPGLTAGTSVVASKTCQTLAQVFFIALGALAAMPHLEPGSGARTGMIVVTLLAGAVVVLLFVLQRFGMFSTMTALLERLPFRWGALERNRAHFRQLDDQIYRFYHGDPVRFFACTVAYLAGWVTDALEILLVGWLLGHPVTWTEALAIEAFIGVAKALGIFVPGALGVQESGVVFLFHLFGLPTPLAAAYAIIRRGREVLFALVGGALLYSQGASWHTLFPKKSTELTVLPK